jgi:hypothetical protein
MFSAKGSLRLAQRYVEPLPSVPAFQRLYSMGCVPRRGEVTLVAGLPGACKSMFALHWVLEMNLPTIYFSVDSNPHTQMSRLIANRTGEWTSRVEETLKAGEGWKYDGVFSGTNVFFSYEVASITWIEHEISAYVELNNQYPDVVVIDNLMDIDHKVESNEYGDMRAILGEFRKIAHDTGITFIVLAHMNESSAALTVTKPDPNRPGDRSAYPLPSRDLAGKVGQRPEIVLSVARDEETQDFRISAVKNRHGESSKGANRWATIGIVPGRSSFYDPSNRLY